MIKRSLKKFADRVQLSLDTLDKEDQPRYRAYSSIDRRLMAKRRKSYAASSPVKVCTSPSLSVPVGDPRRRAIND